MAALAIGGYTGVGRLIALPLSTPPGIVFAARCVADGRGVLSVLTAKLPETIFGVPVALTGGGLLEFTGILAFAVEFPVAFANT